MWSLVLITCVNFECTYLDFQVPYKTIELCEEAALIAAPKLQENQKFICFEGDKFINSGVST